MSLQKVLLVCLIAAAVATILADKPRKTKKTKKAIREGDTASQGLQCYNCLSYDHPGCWDPQHPEFANVTIPNIDCYMPDRSFSCVVITSESAKLVDSGLEIGPVRVRTCVPRKEFPHDAVSYDACRALSRELVASEVFSRVSVRRPRCDLCTEPLCAVTN